MDLERNKDDFEHRLYEVQDMGTDLESAIQALISEYKGYMEKDLDYVLTRDLEDLEQGNLDLRDEVKNLTELLKQAQQEIADGKTEESSPLD